MAGPAISWDGSAHPFSVTVEEAEAAGTCCGHHVFTSMFSSCTFKDLLQEPLTHKESVWFCLLTVKWFSVVATVKCFSSTPSFTPALGLAFLTNPSACAEKVSLSGSGTSFPVMVSFNCQLNLELTGKRVSVRCCLHWVGPWTCWRGTVLIKPVHIGRPSLLWAAPFLRQRF